MRRGDQTREPVLQILTHGTIAPELDGHWQHGCTVFMPMRRGGAAFEIAAMRQRSKS